MKTISPFRGAAYSCAALLLYLNCGAVARATDTYDPVHANLQIPRLAIGNALYSNVVVHVTIADVRYNHGGTPAASVDSYDPTTSILSIPSVNVNGTLYTNVGVAGATLVSIDAASGIDTYDVASGELRIATVTAGGATYNNVVVAVVAANVVANQGGLPGGTEDSYAGGLLQLPAVQVGGRFYTNVTLNVALDDVRSLGAASVFQDAPVQGLCYSTSPSATATAAPTNLAGQFLYQPGDNVTFWIDGTGGGCTGTTATGSYSVTLGNLTPTGSVTSVLALPGGAQVADTLTALNVGTASLINVSGLQLQGADIGLLSQYIKDQGYNYNDGTYSIDALFNGVQNDTVLAGSLAPPPFVTPVASSASTYTSVLDLAVVQNLLATDAALPGQPTTFAIPSGGLLLFEVLDDQYTCGTPAACGPADVSYTINDAEITWLDGSGNAMQLYNPGLLQNTGVTLADVTGTGTYQVSGNTLTVNTTGSDLYTGDTDRYIETRTLNYRDSGKLIQSLSYVDTYTSGANIGSVFTRGSAAVNSTILTPLTPGMLAGHSITFASGGCPNDEQTISFAGSASSVTSSDTCGGNPLTLVQSSVPGILLGTDSTGFTIFVGLRGAGLQVGASIVQIQVQLGSQGLNGNGNPQQWQIGSPLLSVQ